MIVLEKERRVRCYVQRTRLRARPRPRPLFSLAILFLFVASCASAKTTFRNCTYDGKLHAASSTISIADLSSASNSISWGVSLDSASLSIEDYITALGGNRSPTIINLYFDAAHLGGLNEPLNCQIAAAKAAGAILMLTIEPWGGLDTITPAAISDLARLTRDINDDGVPVFLRFAHEMNGGWYPWGARPSEFRAAFRAIAAAVRAPSTAMVWAPNTGVGYPFNGAGQYLPSDPDSAEFKQMDSNSDGRLDSSDDPFTPYYPGDDVVDWVGVSLYSKLTDAADANEVSARISLRTYISNPNGDFDLYTQFAKEKGKPFMIAETAAAYYPEYPEGDGEVKIKRGWWEQFWSDDTLEAYPLLKAAVWFEFRKAVEGDELRDYTITSNKDVLNAFLDDIGATGAVNFLSEDRKKLTGGDGGCTCDRGDGGDGKKKGAAPEAGVDGRVVLLGVGTLLVSFWMVLAM